MDIDTTSGVFRRLEVVDTGRRRRWSSDEKMRIVEESYAGGPSASAVARQHGISPAHLFLWRKQFRGEAALNADRGDLVPAVATPRLAVGGRMEIVLANGRRIVVDRDCAPRDVLALVQALERP